MKSLSKILCYVYPYWRYAFLNVVFNALSILFSLVSLTMVVPFLGLLFGTVKLVTIKPVLTLSATSVINTFYFQISNIIISKGKVDALLFICILIVVMFLLKNLFRYLALYFIAPLRNGVVKDLRNDIFKRIMILPLSYYTEQKKGDIITRMTGDVQEIEWSVMSTMVMLFRDPMTIIAYMVTLFVISFKLTLFMLILIPVTGLVIGGIGKSLRRSSNQVQKKMGEMVSVIEETIGGLRIIKGFNSIDYTHDKFRDHNTYYTRKMNRVYRKRDAASPVSEFLGTIVMVTIMWFGGQLVLKGTGNISAEEYIAYMVIFSQVIPPSKSFTDAIYSIQKGRASVDRVMELLNAEEVIVEAPDALSVKEFNEYIEFRNVSFAYQNETVLKNINLKIEKGKTVAIVGHSGAGKTTLADLLPRFYDCTEGEIRIDDIPIKKIKIADLRGLMGLVTQESVLFNDTVYNNIAFGLSGVSEHRVIDAAKNANAHEFVMQMENAYQTNIGDRGSKLSGGQCQRLNIARAILRNPYILVLDEATSSLDTESERAVQDALYKLMENRTSVVIAHRLSTIQHADMIVVLEKGEIVEQGTHAELTAINGVYKKLCDLQSFE